MNLTHPGGADAERDPRLARELSLMQEALDLVYAVLLEPHSEPLPGFRPDAAEPRP